jgi:hypothetical protein
MRLKFYCLCVLLVSDFGLNVSFHNIREKVGEVQSPETYATSAEIFRWIHSKCYTVTSLYWISYYLTIYSIYLSKAMISNSEYVAIGKAD